MAIRTCIFTFSWENDNAMQLQRTDEDSVTKLIIKVEENGLMASTMDDVIRICKDCFNHKLDQIKDEMIV